jgi:hypothetical protein
MNNIFISCSRTRDTLEWRSIGRTSFRAIEHQVYDYDSKPWPYCRFSIDSTKSLHCAPFGSLYLSILTVNTARLRNFPAFPDQQGDLPEPLQLLVLLLDRPLVFSRLATASQRLELEQSQPQHVLGCQSHHRSVLGHGPLPGRHVRPGQVLYQLR